MKDNNTYYDIIKSTKTIVNSSDGIYIDPKDTALLSRSGGNKYLKCLLSIIIEDTYYSPSRLEYYNKLNVYKLGNYITAPIGSIYNINLFEQDIFNLFGSPLTVSLIKRLMDKYEINNPFNLLYCNIDNEEIVDVINDLIYSDGGVFYGIKNYYRLFTSVGPEKIDIYESTITMNNIHIFINSLLFRERWCDNTCLTMLDYNSPFLNENIITLKTANGKIVNGCGIGGIRGSWIFFLNKKQLEEFVEEYENYLLKSKPMSIAQDIGVLNMLNDKRKKLGEQVLKLKKEKANKKNLITI